jgi:Phage tail tube protein
MADSNLIAGVLYATIDGTNYRVSGEGKYRVSSDKRESLPGQDGIHGFSSRPQPGMMGWKGRDSSDPIITALSNMTSGTVQFELANGKLIIGRGMWRVGDPIEVNTEDGTFDVEFEGPDVSEN